MVINTTDAKRSMKGVYQHCADKHLHRYLAEFDFRYNHRSKHGYGDVDRQSRRSAPQRVSASCIGNLVKPTFRFKAARFLRWATEEALAGLGPRRSLPRMRRLRIGLANTVAATFIPIRLK